jgi:drug/metabolite transporter (DMT)-like permease
MVVVVLCYLIYNETMSNQEIIALVLAFFAVTMTIMGGYQGQSANSSTAGLIMLILNPFVIASGQLLMRKLKKLH